MKLMTVGAIALALSTAMLSPVFETRTHPGAVPLGPEKFHALAALAEMPVIALGGMTASDEIVKGAMAGYVFEHFEIASYTALIAAAKTAGDPETARVCEAILVQEEAMADWLAAHLPEELVPAGGGVEVAGRIVLVGGGHTHLQIVEAFGKADGRLIDAYCGIGTYSLPLAAAGAGAGARPPARHHRRGHQHRPRTYGTLGHL